MTDRSQAGGASSFTLVETVAQVQLLLAQSAAVAASTIVCTTPEAAYACQQANVSYVRLEDYSGPSDRRPGYASAVTGYVAWQDWIDAWLREHIPAFGATQFRPAEGASFRLQRMHGEVWATAQALHEFLDATHPSEIRLWYSAPNVPLHLEPGGSPIVHLAAAVAAARGISVVNLAGEAPPTEPDLIVRAEHRSVLDRARERVMDSWVRGVGAALRSGGLTDGARALMPALLRRRRVLSCGFGYDVQRMVLELRRSGVGVTQVSNRLADAVQRPELVAEMERLAPELFSRPEFWAPMEACGVGRLPLWEAVCRRWWHDLVPVLWESYRSAERMLDTESADAILLSDLGSADLGSMMRQAGTARGIHTYLYQHGGSADLDSPSLLPWVRGEHTLFVYGPGTQADLSDTFPHTTGCTATMHATGSATIDELNAKGRTRRHRRLREQLQGGDPRPLVLYAPTHFAHFFRAVSQLADHPVVPYFEMLQRVIALFGAAPHVRLVFKHFGVANDSTRIMPEFIRRTVPDAIVTTTSLRDLMWAADAIIVDHVITAACEVLLTDAPCTFFMPSTSPQAERGRALLRRAATVAETEDTFVRAIEELLQAREFPRVTGRDRAFLRAFGIADDDGRSARRASRIVLRTD